MENILHNRLMKKHLRLLLTLFLFLSLLTKPTLASRLTELAKKSLTAIKEKRYEDARKEIHLLINQHPNDAELLAMCYNNLASLDRKDGLYITAIDHLKQAIAEYRKINKDTLLAKCLYNKGLMLKENSQYEGAAEDLIEAIKIFKKEQMLVDLSKAYNVLANIFRRTHDYEVALEYHNNALKTTQQLKDSVLTAKYLNNRGKTYVEMEYFNLAIEDFQQALSLKRSKAMRESMAYTYYNLGEAEFLMGKLSKAGNYFLTALKIHSEFKNKTEQAHCYNYLGRLNSMNKKWDRAAEYFKKALYYTNILNNSSFNLECYKFQLEHYELIGKTDSALKYSKRYIDLHEDILNKEKQKAINELEIKYRLKEKDQENALLAQKAELDKLKLAEQKTQIDNWQLTTVLAILLVLLVGFFGYRLYRLSEKEKKLADKERRLNHEQHHRIKNHLQALAGLLSFQHKKNENNEAKEAIEESKNRIRAINTLHQHLYRADSASSLIQLDAYLKDLIENLILLFGNKKIKTTVNLEAMQLDADRVLPLGLICNEIITNAYKYGLTKADAHLKVELSTSKGFIELSIQDNGEGSSIDAKEGSMGIELIEQLAKQIDAKVDTNNKNGTAYHLSFSA